jgi:hypothetical protein
MQATATASTISVRAGYSAVQSGSSATATATFVVPTLTCPNSTSQGVGLGTSIHTSTPDSDAAAIELLCSNGVPFYRADAQINNVGLFVGGTTLPGDVVQVTTSVTATVTTITIHNLTQNWSTQNSGAGGSPVLAIVGALEGACAVQGTSGPCFPIAQFSSPLAFSGAGIDGVDLASAQAVRSNATSNTGSLEAIATALTRGRTGFRVNWVSSCTPDASGLC